MWIISYCAITLIVWMIIAVMYIVIIIALAKARQKAQRPMSTTDRIVRAKMITIAITDLICWLPLYVVLLRAGFGLGLDTHSLPFIAILSLPLNSCINPILYTIFITTFINTANNWFKILGCCLLLMRYCWSCGERIEHNERYQEWHSVEIESRIKKHLAKSCLTTSHHIDKSYLLVEQETNTKACPFELLKMYSKDEIKCWKNEMQFYIAIKRRNLRLQNIAKCLRLINGGKCQMVNDELVNIDIQGKLITCYATKGQNVSILSHLMELESKILQPTQILQILKDTALAVDSLQSNLIAHGFINAGAVFVVTEPSSVTARLGSFSRVKIYWKDKNCNDNGSEKTLALHQDVIDFGHLSETLSLYCCKKLSISTESLPESENNNYQWQAAKEGVRPQLCDSYSNFYHN
ncbi:G-protein coupled receptor GRL101-like protein [Trichoplax sp. H2]|nr:G-protein coupled receptor GRL101-like protein [Trichoplax sp. H2]|eukprot:RDD36113.1 G-protein coupled receptor GRL101-like protein [Trichoplax sp. H2]